MSGETQARTQFTCFTAHFWICSHFVTNRLGCRTKDGVAPDFNEELPFIKLMMTMMCLSNHQQCLNESKKKNAGLIQKEELSTAPHKQTSTSSRSEKVRVWAHHCHQLRCWPSLLMSHSQIARKQLESRSEGLRLSHHWFVFVFCYFQDHMYQFSDLFFSTAFAFLAIYSFP